MPVDAVTYWVVLLGAWWGAAASMDALAVAMAPLGDAPMPLGGGGVCRAELTPEVNHP